ncbi:MAG TPA: hypothetical protein VHE99_06040 [Gammaproteobacteria bacterium]|nr:hypothetical protein [Gammaproteobacteria bacterium]
MTTLFFKEKTPEQELATLERNLERELQLGIEVKPFNKNGYSEIETFLNKTMLLTEEETNKIDKAAEAGIETRFETLKNLYNALTKRLTHEQNNTELQKAYDRVSSLYGKLLGEKMGDTPREYEPPQIR